MATRVNRDEVIMLTVWMVAGVALWPAHPAASTFRATVVDGETGAPLERAVVIVVWRRCVPDLVHIDSPIPYQVEQVTGPDGTFSVDVWPGRVSPGWCRRDVTIYKPHAARAWRGPKPRG